MYKAIIEVTRHNLDGTKSQQVLSIEITSKDYNKALNQWIDYIIAEHKRAVVLGLEAQECDITILNIEHKGT